jgi:phage terminase small subunit
VANKYASLIKAYCSELGLSPSARVKLTLPKVEGKEPNEFDNTFGDI